jgi:hypothetical protein
MGLNSGGSVLFSCCSGGGGSGVMVIVGGGGGGSVRMAPLSGSGGGGSHTSDPISGETRPTSLAPVRGARILMGRPLGLIWIHVVCLYADIGEDSGTDITLTGWSSSSSMAAAIPSPPLAAVTPSFPSSPPSLGLGDDSTDRLSATE